VGFDPDAYLAEKESGGFDPDAYLADSEPKAEPLMSGVRKFVQGGSAGFSDEAAGLVEGAGKVVGLKGLGGPMKDIEVDDDGPSLDWNTLRDAYMRARDKERAALKKDAKDNPAISSVAELGGAIMSPVNKIMPSASMAKSGATIGGITGLGMSDADNVTDMALDTGKGVALGGVLGYGADKATPYILKGANKVGDAYQGVKTKIGEKASDLAEKLAFKSGGATLKDFRTAADKDQINKVGRYILDKGLKAGDTVDDIAGRAVKDNEAAGQALDDIYGKASELFKDKMSKVGFDPLRDKNDILRAAKAELGDAVGSEAAINKLSKYLDEVAAKHGDDPMQAALSKYKSEVGEYVPKQRQFLKDKKSFQSQIGSAADDLDQAILPGTFDDFQRTGSAPRTLELNGKAPSQITPEGSSFNTQMDMFEIPGRPQAGFNSPRGDDLLPMQQQMFLDDASSNLMLQGKQGGTSGLELTPRSFQNVDDIAIQSGKGQMQMPFAPEAPIRPVRPEDIRNPMTPRRANDIKGALDSEINYARNPLSKDPASEKAFYGARKELGRKVEQGLDDLGGGELVDQLRAANKEYGTSKQVTQMAEDRARRVAANKMFGLTDTIAGGAATTYGAVTGDWQTAVGAMALKKGLDRAGTSTLAVAADKAAKFLMKSPRMQKMAVESPKAFGALVYNFVNKAEQSGVGMAIPKAADGDKQSLLDRTIQNPNQLDSIKSEKLKEELIKQREQRKLKEHVPVQEAQASFINGN